MGRRAGEAKALAIAIAVILVVVSTYSLLSKDRGVNTELNNSTTVLGPMINVASPAPMTNNTSISLQIFSSVPDSVIMQGMGSYSIAGFNQSNNPYYVQLLNITFNSSSFRTLLSPMFYTIASQWSKILISRHNEPSLTVEATKSVWNSSSVSLYGYYNNIPYRPWDIQSPSLVSNRSILDSLLRGMPVDISDYSSVYLSNTSFNISLQFPGKPYQIISFADNSTPSVAEPYNTYYTRYFTTTGISSGTYDSTTGINFTNGYFPLITVHLSKGVAKGKSLLDISSSLLLMNTTVGMNSANTYETGSGQYSSTMSTNPSQNFIENGSFDSGFISGTNEWVAYPLNSGSNRTIQVNETTAFVALTNATYEFVHYNRYTKTTTTTYHWVQIYYYEPGKGYVFEPPRLQYITSSSSTSYDGHGTVAQITHIGTHGNISLVAGFLDTEVNTVIQKVLEKSYSGNITLDAGKSVSQSTVWDRYSGYSNAASAIKDAHDALAIFSASLGLGLAITDTLAALNGADFDASESGVVAQSLDLISQATGMAATVTGLFSSISFLAKSNTAFLGSGMSDEPLPSVQGSNYTIAYYQSSTPVTFSYDGNSYSFYAPADYFNATTII